MQNTPTITAQAALSLLAQKTVEFANNDKAPATLTQYESCWKKFKAFCETYNLNPIPAEIQTIAIFLTQLANEGKAATTINGYTAALKYFNQRHGHTIDFNHPILTSVISGIFRTIGTKSKGSDAIIPDDLRVMLNHCGEGLTEIRNRAILLLGFSGAMRRSEMTGLISDDITFVDEGMVIHLQKSKTDQTGNGVDIAVPYANDTTMCAVRAVKRLIQINGSGPLFRRIRKNGLIGDEALSDTSVWRIITDIAELSGLSGKITPHSLRSGFCTTAAMNSTRIDKIATHARHNNIQTTMRYIRDANKFKDNAANGLL